METDTPNTPSSETPSEPSLTDKLRALLVDFPDAPTTAQIDGFKSKYGDIYMSALSEEELFIFRALNRKEHRELNANIAEGKIPAEEFEEKIITGCLLWTSAPGSIANKAGTIPSLFEQVMQNSNFLPSQMLANLVIKL